MNRKRIFSTIAGVAACLLLLALAGCCNLPHATEQTQDESPETYQQSTYNNNFAQQDRMHQISSKEAREIAVDFVGYGTAHDVMAFTNKDTLIFEVDVRHDAMRYVVLLNAESGNVTSLSRHEDESASAIVSPDADIVPDNHAPYANNEAIQSDASPYANGQGNRLPDSAISLERAIEIAYADLKSRGINAAYRSNSGLDRERGQLVWELLFKTHGHHMPLIEYYINADNGNIVKFEWDD